MKHFFEPNIYFKYDYTGLKNHLEKMALKGWELTRIGIYLHYKKVEPAPLHYAITYFPFSGLYEPETEEEETFNDFCEMAGWEEVTSMKSLKVFINRNANPLPLETEPEVIFNNITTDSAGELWLNIIPALICLGAIIWEISRYVTSPLEFLGSNSGLPIVCIFTVLFLVISVNLLGYYRWYRRAKKESVDGIFTETRYHAKLQYLFVSLGIILCIAFSIAGSGFVKMFALIMIAYALSYFFMDHTRTRLRKRKIYFWINYLAGVAIALVFILPIYTSNTLWNLTRDESVWDVFETDSLYDASTMVPSYVDLSSREEEIAVSGNASLLLSYTTTTLSNYEEVWQDETGEVREKYDFAYTVVKEKNDMFHKKILESLEYSNDYSDDLTVNMVYELDDRMIRLQFAEEVPEEEVARILEVLETI